MQDDLLCTVPHTCRKPVRLQIFSSPCVETICLPDSPSPSGSPTTPPRVEKICMHDSPPPALIQSVVTSNISTPSLPRNLLQQICPRSCYVNHATYLPGRCFSYLTAGALGH